jgi:hypothetical protein
MDVEMAVIGVKSSALESVEDVRGVLQKSLVRRSFTIGDIEKQLNLPISNPYLARVQPGAGPSRPTATKV